MNLGIGLTDYEEDVGAVLGALHTLDETLIRLIHNERYYEHLTSFDRIFLRQMGKIIKMVMRTIWEYFKEK